MLVQADSSALAALQDEENAEIKALADSFGSLTEVPDYESALMELEAGSADAVAMDEGVAKDKQTKNDNIAILEDIISKEQYGIGFKQGNTELRDQVWATCLKWKPMERLMKLLQNIHPSMWKISVSVNKHPR